MSKVKETLEKIRDKALTAYFAVSPLVQAGTTFAATGGKLYEFDDPYGNGLRFASYVSDGLAATTAFANGKSRKWLMSGAYALEAATKALLSVAEYASGNITNSKGLATMAAVDLATSLVTATEITDFFFSPNRENVYIADPKTLRTGPDGYPLMDGKVVRAWKRKQR